MFLLILSFALIDKTLLAKGHLETFWETEKVFELPESVVFDQKNEVLYVSNITEHPFNKDGTGFISKVGLDGKIIELKWVKSLNAPKGLTIVNDKLFIADVDELVEVDIATSKIINESGGYSEQERIRIAINIAYGTNLEKAKEIMHNIAVASDKVCTDPDPRVRFRTFGESGLNLQLLAWIDKPEIRGSVIDELSTNIYNAFNEEKIEIPFPQRTVHIKKTDI